MTAVRFALVVAIAAVALVGAGCGGDDEGSGDATGTTGTETTETTEAPSGEVGAQLDATVGPGFTIEVSQNDEPVTSLPAGSYPIVVEDFSAAHNFHLTGPAVDISTDVAEEGTQAFTVELQPGTYTFVCDPHASQMKGSFEVS